ncbi:MAG TPA: RNA polymerase sigma-54 factor, partial [Flavobacteriales bacterium]|nr:RNA polymerase sigma-54 factor [Flavobacteriales bacterium]
MLKQNLSLKLQQKLSPQQIQLMKMLQLPTVELEQRVKDELSENPALEEGEERDDAETVAEENTESLDQQEGEQDDDR